MVNLRDKRGASENVIYGAVIFILLNLVFFSIMTAAVWRSGTTNGLYEEAYAKQIALLIDAAQPGTVLTFNLSPLVQKVGGDGSQLDVSFTCTNKGGAVSVRLASGKAYSYPFFTKLSSCTPSFSASKRTMRIKI